MRETYVDAGLSHAKAWGCVYGGGKPCALTPERLAAVDRVSKLIGVTLPDECPGSFAFDKRIPRVLRAKPLIENGHTALLANEPRWVFDAVSEINIGVSLLQSHAAKTPKAGTK